MKFLKVLFIATLAFLYSCSEDEDTNDITTLPTSFSFNNVDYGGQTERLNQMDQMMVYIKTNTSGAEISALKLQDMFSNKDGNGGGNFNFTSTKQIKDKVYTDDLNFFNDVFLDLEYTSKLKAQPASEGVAGLLTTGTSNYIVNENGVEPTQLAEKGLMGSLMFYQISQVYLSTSKMDVDNTTLVEGKNYTAMQHHWDEAFGYLGIPIDYPTNTNGIRYWGKYLSKASKEVTGEAYDVPQNIMNAFIKGRDAINRKDLSTRDAQIKIINENLEIAAAATAVSYMNQALANFSDNAKRCHVLSEGMAFIRSLQFISQTHRKISYNEVQDLLGLLGSNFWTIDTQKINQIKSKLSTIYGFDTFKDNL